MEPSRSPDSDIHTQPIPRDQAAPTGSRLQPDEPPEPAARPGDAPTDPADPAWPPSWGQAPSSGEQAPASPDSPAWTQPKAAQGPSWTQPTGSAAGVTREQPADPDAGSSWAQSKGPEDQADQPQPGWSQGGGGYPTVPAWGARPADAGSPRGRRPSRWLAGVLAGAVLLAAGFGISQALDNDAEPAGAGIPAAGPAPVAAAPAVPSGEEPAAAVAKALLPTVVEIRRGTDGLGSGFVYDKN
ncbi:MAG TPA: hypothetical protein VEY96_03250, partial [Actinomycetes bacterium]|nr:hypothetical protein [Actinomycetes bacterium]